MMNSTVDNGDRGASGWLDRNPDSGLPVKRCLRWLKSLVLPQKGAKSEQLRATAYLDGLRGFAAFLVYWHHHQLWAHAFFPENANEAFENAWGYKGRFRFATFYGIRNFFSGGHFAVAIFFVLSGYVLSLKPLRLIHSGDLDKLGDYLASALFRRWFRLYLPLIITTFVYVTSWHVFGIWNSSCEPKGTYGEEVWNWYAEFKSFSFVFKEGGVPWVTYNGHLWSIPLEMRGSIIVYTVTLALSKATTNARLLCELGLIVYFLYVVDGYYGALFMAGMLHCDLDLLSRRIDDEFPALLRRLEPYKTTIFHTLFTASMYLSGVPTQVRDMDVLRANPGWYWMSFLKPQAVFDFKWFYLFWAAAFIVGAIPRMPWLKRFFESRFCQYLGRHSFSLYLVHGPVLSTLGDRIYTAVGWARPIPRDQEMLAAWINRFPLPRTGPLGLEIAFLLPHVILLPVTLWLADMVTRTVDEPSVRFAAWLYDKVLGGPPPSKSEDATRLA